MNTSPWQGHIMLVGSVVKLTAATSASSFLMPLVGPDGLQHVTHHGTTGACCVAVPCSLHPVPDLAGFHLLSPGALPCALHRQPHLVRALHLRYDMGHLTGVLLDGDACSSSWRPRSF